MVWGLNDVVHWKYFVKYLAYHSNSVRLAIIALWQISCINILFISGRGKFQVYSPISPSSSDSGIIKLTSSNVFQDWQDYSLRHAVHSLLFSAQGDFSLLPKRLLHPSKVNLLTTLSLHSTCWFSLLDIFSQPPSTWNAHSFLLCHRYMPCSKSVFKLASIISSQTLVFIRNTGKTVKYALSWALPQNSDFASLG